MRKSDIEARIRKAMVELNEVKKMTDPKRVKGIDFTLLRQACESAEIALEVALEELNKS